MLHLIPILLLAAAEQQAPNPAASLYSTEKELALGTSLANDFRKSVAPLESNAAQQYVERLGRQLAAHLPEPASFSYKFHLTANSGDSAQLQEPCSFPGGFVFVPASLFAKARDEAEFAGMLVHAMAHIAARHGVGTAAKGHIANLGSIPLVFIGGWAATCTDTNAKLTVPLGYLKFAHENELDADQLAIKAMVRAGYDPAGLARYIRREQIETDEKASRFSPLPPLEDRLKALDAAIAALQPATYPQGTEFSSVKQEVGAQANPLKPAPERKGPPTLRR